MGSGLFRHQYSFPTFLLFIGLCTYKLVFWSSYIRKNIFCCWWPDIVYTCFVSCSIIDLKSVAVLFLIQWSPFVHEILRVFFWIICCFSSPEQVLVTGGGYLFQSLTTNLFSIHILSTCLFFVFVFFIFSDNLGQKLWQKPKISPSPNYQCCSWSCDGKSLGATTLKLGEGFFSELGCVMQK